MLEEQCDYNPATDVIKGYDGYRVKTKAEWETESLAQLEDQERSSDVGGGLRISFVIVPNEGMPKSDKKKNKRKRKRDGQIPDTPCAPDDFTQKKPHTHRKLPVVKQPSSLPVESDFWSADDLS
jgi:hypothetical protein